MNNYNLNQPYYLKHDIGDVLKKINSLYNVQIGDNENEFLPKTIVNKNLSWVSSDCQTTFNKIVPSIKTMTKDMYSIIESIFKSSKGTFEKLRLEEKYSKLKELQLLNNKFKHYFDTEPKIALIALTLIEPIGHRIDAVIQYKYKDGKIDGVRFADLIKCFLLILEEFEIINIERK